LATTVFRKFLLDPNFDERTEAAAPKHQYWRRRFHHDAADAAMVRMLSLS